MAPGPHWLPDRMERLENLRSQDAGGWITMYPGLIDLNACNVIDSNKLERHLSEKPISALLHCAPEQLRF